MAEAVTVTKVIEIDVKASADASAQMKKIADGLKGVEDSSKKSMSALQEMQSMIKGFIGFQIWDMVGDKVIAAVQAFQQVSDASRQLSERMKLVTMDTGSATAAFQSIIDISVRQGRELDGVGKLYERVARSSDQLAISQKGVALITEGVAASLRLAGSTTQESNAVMLQFSQALASGKLGGDEFRSMMENDTVLMKAFAEQLGTTLGGLRQMSKDGKLGPEELQKAMLSLGKDGLTVMDRMIEQAEKLPKTWAQAVDGMKAAITDYVNALQGAATDTESFMVRTIKSFTEFLRGLAGEARDSAEIEAAVKKAMFGDQFKDKSAPPIPVEAQADLDKLKRIDELNKEIAKTQKDLANAQKIDKEGGFFSKLFNANEVEAAEKTLRGFNAELDVLHEQLARNFAKFDDDSIGGLITGKAKGQPDKLKGVTDEDEIKKIMLQLNAAGRISEGIIDHDPPWMAEYENLKAKVEAAAHKLSDAARKAAEAIIEAKVKANFIAKTQAEFEQKLPGILQKSDEREIAEDIAKQKKSDAAHDAAVKKAIAAYNKEHLDKDPFEGAQEEIKSLTDLWYDSRTTQEQADKIVLAIHAIREKAAKQLLGEKDPLKDIAGQMADSWETAFNRMEDDLLDFNKSVKQVFSDMVLSILRDFAKIEMKQELQPLMQMGKDWIKNDSSNFFGGIWDSLMSANGNVFTGGVQMFANGGVLNGPTPFTFNGGKNRGVGGEAGPEALVPLRRGSDGNLGIAQAPVQVIINNNASNSKATATESTTASGTRQIQVMIEDTVASGIGSGKFDSTLGKSFGLNRRGT